MSNILYVAFYLPVVVPAEQAGAFDITLNYELSFNYMNNVCSLLSRSRTSL